MGQKTSILSSGKKRFGALFWVILMLFSSAILRLGIEIGPALAREAGTETLDLDGEMKSEAETSKNMMQTAEDLERLLRELQRREAIVENRERQIEDRMHALRVADDAIEAKLAALSEVEDGLRQTLAMADGASERDLDSLTNVYNSMKPKDAAGLFETMDPAFAAGFLARMRPDIAAGVMARLSPDAAYSISVILAGRNTGAPTQ